jgi:hypothetical protein
MALSSVKKPRQEITIRLQSRGVFNEICQRPSPSYGRFSASPQLNPMERVWLYWRECLLSHCVLKDYGVALKVVCRA